MSDFEHWEFAPQAWPIEQRHNWQPTPMQELMIAGLVRVLQPLRDRVGPIDITHGIRLATDYQRLIDEGRHPSPTSDHYFGQPIKLVNDARGFDWWVYSTGACDFVPREVSVQEAWEVLLMVTPMAHIGQIIREQEGDREWIHLGNPRALIYSPAVVALIGRQTPVLFGKDGRYSVAPLPLTRQEREDAE